MAKYRNRLPQLGDRLFLTDGGIETHMIFHEGFDMPAGEAFKYMESEEGRAWFIDYFRQHAETARQKDMGFVFESPTWRANVGWGKRLGYDAETLVRINRAAIELMAKLREELETEFSPMVLSGCIGPLGDGYRPDQTLTIAEAEEQHAVQVRAFADGGADMVAAITMNTVEEAVGVARAARRFGMPCCISFTVETDGCLPTGQTLKEAILSVDAATGRYPAYYMINCAHPTHFANVLASRENWVARIRGIRANASKRSHDELDNSTELDEGDPVELAAQYGDLRRQLPALRVLGGCCGTDHRHVAAIAEACSTQRAGSRPASGTVTSLAG